MGGTLYLTFKSRHDNSGSSVAGLHSSIFRRHFSQKAYGLDVQFLLGDDGLLGCLRRHDLVASGNLDALAEKINARGFGEFLLAFAPTAHAIF